MIIVSFCFILWAKRIENYLAALAIVNTVLKILYN